MEWTKISFNIKDLLYLLSLGGMLMIQYFNLKTDIEKLALYKTTDDKIVNSRLTILEAATSQNSRDINKIDKTIYRINAVLPKNIILEDEN